MCPSSPEVRSEALGFICYELETTVCDDFLGLTDTTIANNGSIYQSTFGREDPQHITQVIRPEVFITHSGLGHLIFQNYHNLIQSNYLIYYLPRVQLTLAIRNDVNASVVIPKGWLSMKEMLKF